MKELDAPPQMSVMDALMESDEERTELDKIFEQFLDPANISHNTELSSNEITAFSALGPLADKHHLVACQEFIQKNLIFRVSKGRKGRAEWVKIITHQRDRQEEQTRGMGRFFHQRGGRQ